MKNFLLILFYFSSIGAFAAPVKKAQNFFDDKTKIENPFNLRDPFKAPPSPQDKRDKRKGFYVSGKSEYSNIQEVALDRLTIDSIKVVGVMIGKERRALISSAAGGKGGKVIILKEGMKIGPESAELKAILPGGIVLVEKMINVYGEEEYLETVIPISK